MGKIVSIHVEGLSRLDTPIYRIPGWAVESELEVLERNEEEANYALHEFGWRFKQAIADQRIPQSATSMSSVVGNNVIFSAIYIFVNDGPIEEDV